MNARPESRRGEKRKALRFRRYQDVCVAANELMYRLMSDARVEGKTPEGVQRVTTAFLEMERALGRVL